MKVNQEKKLQTYPKKINVIFMFDLIFISDIFKLQKINGVVKSLTFGKDSKHL